MVQTWKQRQDMQDKGVLKIQLGLSAYKPAAKGLGKTEIAFFANREAIIYLISHIQKLPGIQDKYSDLLKWVLIPKDCYL